LAYVPSQEESFGPLFAHEQMFQSVCHFGLIANQPFFPNLVARTNLPQLPASTRNLKLGA
jgi:hypothetical protein